MATRPDIQEVHVRLRDYRPDDLEALWQLDQVCFEEGISYSREELLHYIRLRTTFTLIAETDEGISGFIIAHRRRGGFGHILTIDVDPQHRQRGVGTHLLRHAHQRLQREGCHTVFLETAVDNTAAMAFYKRHGYTVVRTIPRYYHATGMDAFLLSVPLSPVAQP